MQKQLINKFALVLSVLSLWANMLMAQVQIVPLEKPMGPMLRMSNIGIPQTYNSTVLRQGRVASRVLTLRPINYGFFEDWSSTRGSTPDTNKWLPGSGVYINNSFAVSPPSFNTATFDGMRPNGTPYADDGSTSKGYCDTLTTQQLDLTARNNPSQHWVLRFRWQPGSFVPESIADTNSFLLVQVRSNSQSDAAAWRPLWKHKGTDSLEVDSFTSALVVIPDSLISTDFQLRWINYGERKSYWDTWNLDYIQIGINLDQLADTLSDVTFTNTPSRLVRKYSMLPTSFWNAAAASYLTDTITATLRNNRPIYQFPITFDPTVVFYKEPSKDSIGTIDPFAITDRIFERPNYVVKRPIRILRADFPAALTAILPDSVTGITTQFSNITQTANVIRSNDTIKTTMPIGKILARDDGVAEAQLFVQGPLAKGAVKFTAPVQDTLTAVQMYFPNIRADYTSTNQISFTLKILRKLGTGIVSRPDRLDSVYHQEQVTLTYNPKLDSFTTYPLSNKVIIKPGDFYIGYQQIANVQNEVRLGFDCNYPDSTPFYYNRDGTWQLFDRSNGTPMVRAVFGNPNSILSTPEITRINNTATLYPNPSASNSTATLIIQHASSATLYDMQGRLLKTYELDPYSEAHQLNWPENLHPQVYLLRINTIDHNSSSVIKVLIE